VSSRTYEADVEVLHPALALSRPVAFGAVWGVAMWSAYALVEYFAYSALPLFIRPAAVFTPANWRSNALILDCYWVLGALLGALAGALSHRWTTRSVAGMDRRLDLTSVPGSLSLLFGVAVNLVFAAPLGHSAMLTLATTGALGAAMIWALLRPKSAIARWVQVHPILLAAILIGPSWLSTEPLESWSSKWKGAAALLWIAAALGVNTILRIGKPWPGVRHLTAYLGSLTVLTLVCAGISGPHRARAAVTTPAATAVSGTPVILVSFDTTRADHLSTYGYNRPTTPHLTAFAKGATLYSAAMAASDMTLASHASIFTGVYPSWHGAHPYTLNPPVVRPLASKLPTLAGILASNGYFTGAVAANSVFLVPKWGLGRGFQAFDIESPIEVLGYDRRFNLQHGIRRLLDCCMDTSAFDEIYRRSDEINEYAFSMLDDPAIHNRPVFLFVNYMDAHAPYVAPAPYNTMFLGANHPVEYPRQKLIERELFEGGRHPQDAELDRLVAQYDGGLASQDAAFGQLLDGLRQRGLYDKSLIIVTGDHGEAFGNRDLMEHGVSVYEDQVHVPLVIKYPNQKAAAVVSVPVSHVDILPTVLDTLGYPAPAHAQGRSLRNPAGLENREIMSESFPNLFFGVWQPKLDRTERAIRSGSLKLVVSSSGKNELYDLAADKSELHNLRAVGHSGAEALDTALRRWVHEAPAAGAPSETANEEELRRLKGLGYVQ
jgi:arylsulfatase A-like enzyme